MRFPVALAFLVAMPGCLVQHQTLEDTPAATIVLRYPLMDFGVSQDPENSTVKNWTAFVVLVNDTASLELQGDPKRGGATLWGEHCSLVGWNRETRHVEVEQWGTQGPAVAHPGFVILAPHMGSWQGSVGSSGTGPRANPIDPRSGEFILRSIVSSSNSYRDLVHLRFEQDTEPTAEASGDPGTSIRLQFHTTVTRDGVRHHATDDISIENWGAVPATARAANVYCM